MFRERERDGRDRDKERGRGKSREKDKNKELLKSKRRFVKYFISPEIKIDYKNLQILQKYVTDRGKIVSRRISGITAQQQRDLTCAAKRAKFLGLLPVGSAKKR